ncbi:MAG: ComEC/Rec2 family competence protein [Parachlamydiales bacterium]|nr:ComEC/Rec2 family competence protein [Parachlamydiales bacterium]
MQCFLVFSTAIITFNIQHQVIVKPEIGNAVLHIKSITPNDPNICPWIYRGTANILTDQNTYINVAFKMTSQKGHKRLIGDVTYQCKAKIKPGQTGEFIIKLLDQPKAIKTSYGLTEWRYKSKKFIEDTLLKQSNYPQASEFLIALFSGVMYDAKLTLPLQKAGLTHLIAISGLHFSLIASILGTLLKTLFSQKCSYALLIGFGTLYFLFIGPTPSVERAWLMLTFSLWGIFTDKQVRPLNLLGLAMIVVILQEFHVIKQLGFILSFSLTAALLLLSQPFEHILRNIIPKRSYRQLKSLHIVDQHAYVLLAMIRRISALSIAVNCIAIPFMLTYFGSFPISSLIYNLFFPACMGFLLTGVLVSLPLVTITGWSGPYHVVEFFTHHLLQVAIHPINSLAFQWRCQSVPFCFFVIYMILMMNWAVKRHIQNLNTQGIVPQIFWI